MGKSLNAAMSCTSSTLNFKRIAGSAVGPGTEANHDFGMKSKCPMHHGLTMLV